MITSRRIRGEVLRPGERQPLAFPARLLPAPANLARAVDGHPDLLSARHQVGYKATERERSAGASVVRSAYIAKLCARRGCQAVAGLYTPINRICVASAWASRCA
jgi:hypothetical protein